MHKDGQTWTVMDNKTVNMSRKQRFWINNSVLEATLNQRVAGPIPASPIKNTIFDSFRQVRLCQR